MRNRAARRRLDPSLRRHRDEARLACAATPLAVSDLLKNSLQRSINVAGLEILDMRITHLAYAPEIASIMLRRQQAEALIQAREKMVDGAIGMVKMALERFQADGITDMTPAQRAVSSPT